MTLQTRISDLITAVGTDIKQLRIWITGSSSGDLTGLTTTDKSNLVAAINEVDAQSSAPPDASTTVKGLIEIATLAEVGTGTDSVRAVTPQGVKQETDAVRASILGPGVPSALDTLDELAAALGDDANFASAVTTSLAGKQPIDADLTAIAALVSAANKLPYSTGSEAWSLADFTAFARTLLDDADAATALATLGAQPIDTDLSAIAALTSAANKLPYATGSGTWTLADLTAFARTLLDDADAATALATLGAQPLDTDLTAIAALVSAADKLPYSTGAGTWSLATLTAAGRALIDDADIAAQRTTLSVYSQAELGNPDTDLAALYATAKA